MPPVKSFSKLEEIIRKKYKNSGIERILIRGNPVERAPDRANRFWSAYRAHYIPAENRFVWDMQFPQDPIEDTEWLVSETKAQEKLGREGFITLGMHRGNCNAHIMHPWHKECRLSAESIPALVKQIQQEFPDLGIAEFVSALLSTSNPYKNKKNMRLRCVTWKDDPQKTLEFYELFAYGD